MIGIDQLSFKLIRSICDFLPDNDVRILTRTSREYYHQLNPYLYDRDARTSNRALLWAAQSGHQGTAVLALRARERCNQTAVNRGGLFERSFLHIAADRGHLNIVGLLLENGFDPKSNDTMGVTPLMTAAEKGHEDIVRLLLEKGADTKSKDTKGATPLLGAARNGHAAVVRVLLWEGVDIL